MRTSLAVPLVAALLVGACSGDDDSGSSRDPVAASSTTSTTARPPASGVAVCSLLSLDLVSQVLGERFTETSPGESSCVYRAAGSTEDAISLQVTGLGSNPADLVLETMQGTCDAGTAQPHAFPGADGGFGCLTAGAPTAVAVAHGRILVLIGSAARDAAAQGEVQLLTLLERALQGQS